MARHTSAVGAALVVGLLATGVLGACTGPVADAGAGDGGDGDAVRVTVTTTQAADLVRAVGGEHVAVTALMGPGIDPHLYRATPSDVRALAQADLVVHHGLFLEGRMAEILEGPALERALALTDALPVEALLAPDGAPATERDLADPHVWFDPQLWAQVVEPVAAELAELRPEHRADFAAGAARYTGEIHDADAAAEERLAAIPAGARMLVTSHDAFGYLGRAYDLEVLGVQGLSTEDEAGVHDVRALADLLAERRVPALFTESSVSPASIEAVRAAVADRGWQITVPEQGLYSDALGAAGTDAETYAGMLRVNADTIATALGAP